MMFSQFNIGSQWEPIFAGQIWSEPLKTFLAAQSLRVSENAPAPVYITNQYRVVGATGRVARTCRYGGDKSVMRVTWPASDGSSARSWRGGPPLGAMTRFAMSETESRLDPSSPRY